MAYALGVSEPVSLTVNTFGTSKIHLSDAEIAQKVMHIFDMRPKYIIERLGLTNPIFFDTAAYGHMGRAPFTKTVPIQYLEVRDIDSGEQIVRKTESKEVECFTWEKLDFVEQVKQEFEL